MEIADEVCNMQRAETAEGIQPCALQSALHAYPWMPDDLERYEPSSSKILKDQDVCFGSHIQRPRTSFGKAVDARQI